MKRALFALAVCTVLSGCSSDAPTQGKATTPTQLQSDLDKSLDNLATIPLQNRWMARQTLDRPIGAHGTAAQKARYLDLMKGAPQPPRRMSASKLSPSGGG